MNDERALLAAICAHPEEDTPRLMYADWLDEHAATLKKTERASAQARAELIRVQCALARLPLDSADADAATSRIELEVRESELLGKPARLHEWAPPNRLDTVPDSAHVPLPSAFNSDFVRGFPNFANSGADRYIATGEAVFAISPLHKLECCALSDDEAEPFLALPWLSRVRRFRSYPHFSCGPAANEKILAAPRLANLDSLALLHFDFGPVGAPVAARPLKALRHLDLSSDERCRPDALARLGELLPDETRIREANVACCRTLVQGLSTADLRNLAALPQFRSLERLSLQLKQSPDDGDKVLTAEGARTIAEAPWWASLRALELEASTSPRSWCLRPSEVEALAAVPPAPTLGTLRLPLADDAAFVALTEAPLLASVTALSVPYCNLDDKAVVRLARSPHARSLMRLNLDGCQIGPKGVKALAEAPFAAHLVALDLSRNSVKKAGVDALVSDRFPRLKHLVLRDSVRLSNQKDQLRARFGNGVRF